MSEQRFEYRIQKILESKGYLVINCARSKPFDLVALKDGRTFLIEVKGKNTYYPEEQEKRQRELARGRGMFAVIRQSKKRGKIHLQVYRVWPNCILINDLKEYVDNAV